MMGSLESENESELTSTEENMMSMSSEQEKRQPSDATPTSSTDANTVSKATKIISDDPISSTSSDVVEKSSSRVMDDVDKMSSMDHGDLLDINVSQEKITEDVEDLVHDLESLLGEPTDSFIMPIRISEARNASKDAILQSSVNVNPQGDMTESARDADHEGYPESENIPEKLIDEATSESEKLELNKNQSKKNKNIDEDERDSSVEIKKNEQDSVLTEFLEQCTENSTKAGVVSNVEKKQNRVQDVEVFIETCNTIVNSDYVRSESAAVDDVSIVSDLSQVGEEKSPSTTEKSFEVTQNEGTEKNKIDQQSSAHLVKKTSDQFTQNESKEEIVEKKSELTAFKTTSIGAGTSQIDEESLYNTVIEARNANSSVVNQEEEQPVETKKTHVEDDIHHPSLGNSAIEIHKDTLFDTKKLGITRYAPETTEVEQMIECSVVQSDTMEKNSICLENSASNSLPVDIGDDATSKISREEFPVLHSGEPDCSTESEAGKCEIFLNSNEIECPITVTEGVEDIVDCSIPADENFSDIQDSDFSSDCITKSEDVIDEKSMAEEITECLLDTPDTEETVVIQGIHPETKIKMSEASSDDLVDSQYESEETETGRNELSKLSVSEPEPIDDKSSPRRDIHETIENLDSFETESQQLESMQKDSHSCHKKPEISMTTEVRAEDQKNSCELVDIPDAMRELKEQYEIDDKEVHLPQLSSDNKELNSKNRSNESAAIVETSASANMVEEQKHIEEMNSKSASDESFATVGTSASANIIKELNQTEEVNSKNMSDETVAIVETSDSANIIKEQKQIEEVNLENASEKSVVIDVTPASANIFGEQEHIEEVNSKNTSDEYVAIIETSTSANIINEKKQIEKVNIENTLEKSVVIDETSTSANLIEELDQTEEVYSKSAPDKCISKDETSANIIESQKEIEDVNTKNMSEKTVMIVETCASKKIIEEQKQIDEINLRNTSDESVVVDGVSASASINEKEKQFEEDQFISHEMFPKHGHISEIDVSVDMTEELKTVTMDEKENVSVVSTEPNLKVQYTASDGDEVVGHITEVDEQVAPMQKSNGQESEKVFGLVLDENAENLELIPSTTQGEEDPMKSVNTMVDDTEIKTLTEVILRKDDNTEKISHSAEVLCTEDIGKITATSEYVIANEVVVTKLNAEESMNELEAVELSVVNTRSSASQNHSEAIDSTKEDTVCLSSTDLPEISDDSDMIRSESSSSVAPGNISNSVEVVACTEDIGKITAIPEYVIAKEAAVIQTDSGEPVKELVAKVGSSQVGQRPSTSQNQSDVIVSTQKDSLFAKSTEIVHEINASPDIMIHLESSPSEAPIDTLNEPVMDVSSVPEECLDFTEEIDMVNTGIALVGISSDTSSPAFETAVDDLTSVKSKEPSIIESVKEQQKVSNLEFAPLVLSEDDSDDESVPTLALDLDEQNESPEVLSNDIYDETIVDQVPLSFIDEALEVKPIFDELPGSTVNVQANLETVLAVAALKKIDIQIESEPESLLSDKERSEMEALQRAVESITNSSDTSYVDSLIVPEKVDQELSVMKNAVDENVNESEQSSVQSCSLNVEGDNSLSDIPVKPETSNDKPSSGILTDIGTAQSTQVSLSNNEVKTDESTLPPVKQVRIGVMQDMSLSEKPDESDQNAESDCRVAENETDVPDLPIVEQSGTDRDPEKNDESANNAESDIGIAENIRQPSVSNIETDMLHDVKKIPDSENVDEPFQYPECQKSQTLVGVCEVEFSAKHISKDVDTSGIEAEHKNESQSTTSNSSAPMEVIDEFEKNEVIAGRVSSGENSECNTSPLIVEEKVAAEVVEIECSKGLPSEGIVREVALGAGQSNSDKLNCAQLSEPKVPEQETSIDSSGINSDHQPAVQPAREKEAKLKSNERPRRHKKGENKLEQLSINVDVPEGEKTYSPKISIKPIRVPDDEVSTTSNLESDIMKGSLKMTITKQSDKLHSVLKVVDSESQDNHLIEQEEPIPKLIIKSKMQQVETQHSPKMFTRSSKQSYSPTTSGQRSLSPRITIKPVIKPDTKEVLSPLKIKIGLKSEEASKKKVSIKPILKLDDTDHRAEQSPRITIKPIPKPDVELIPRLNIKPIKKQEDEIEERDKSSPKITIKPIVKPQEESQPNEEEDMVKERIVLKINKGNLPSPIKEAKKREHSVEDEKSEKLAKITVKFSKEGGHPHIVQQVEEGSKRPHEEQAVQEKSKKQKIETESIISTRSRHKELLQTEGTDLRSKVRDAESQHKHEHQSEAKRVKKDDNSARSRRSASRTRQKDIDNTDEIQLIEPKLNSPIVISEDSRSQDSSVIILDDFKEDSASDISLSTINPDSSKGTPGRSDTVLCGNSSITSSTSSPKKRGRPRKVPVEVREEFKEQEEPPAKSKPREEVAAVAQPVHESGRPKRSCVGQSVCDTLGIKPRKPRGPGRGRGSKRGMGNRQVTSQESSVNTALNVQQGLLYAEAHGAKESEWANESQVNKGNIEVKKDESIIEDKDLTILIDDTDDLILVVEPDVVEVKANPSPRGEKRKYKSRTKRKSLDISDKEASTSGLPQTITSTGYIQESGIPEKVLKKSAEQRSSHVVKHHEITETSYLLNTISDVRSSETIDRVAVSSRVDEKTPTGDISIEQKSEVSEDKVALEIVAGSEIHPLEGNYKNVDEKSSEGNSRDIVLDKEMSDAKEYISCSVSSVVDSDTTKVFSSIGSSVTSDQEMPTLVVPPLGATEKYANPELQMVSSSTMLSEVMMVDEETRMSADTSSRAQTPAKQMVDPSGITAEESHSSVNSNFMTESGKTPSSRPTKTPRLEVQEPETHVITPDLLTEYHWNGNGPFMIQEQVAQYLGIKSFKRKYPNIQRRILDMQERDFVREKGLVSENMCDLGLTSVNSADILDIMYSDFQDKYEEYCKHLRDQQAKELITKQRALSLAASQEKNKADILKQAVQSAMLWNARFNKNRKDERRACMDLQTLTVHYPKGRVKQINKTPVGHYPVAVVPGQFTDYYEEFSPTELNNLPLNTMCYDDVRFIPRDDSEDSVSESSDSDSESSGSSSSDSDSSSGIEDCKLCKHSPSKKTIIK